jgi:hypothetical protein
MLDVALVWPPSLVTAKSKSSRVLSQCDRLSCLVLVSPLSLDYSKSEKAYVLS